MPPGVSWSTSRWGLTRSRSPSSIACLASGWPRSFDDPAQVAALRRASAPTLLVGGSADLYWDHDLVQELIGSGWSSTAAGREVVELRGLDHSLEVPGDPQASVDALAALTRAVALFMDLLTTRAAEIAHGE